MNGNIYSHDPYNESYIVNHRINRSNYTSPIQPDTTHTNYRHSYSQAAHEDIHLQQRIQPNTVNQRRLYMVNLQQQQRQRTNLDGYNFRHRGSASPSSYYDRIHAQYRSNSSLNQTLNPAGSSSYFRQSRETSPILTNGRTDQNSTVISANKPSRSIPQPQVNTSKNEYNNFFGFSYSLKYPVPRQWLINLHQIYEGIMMIYHWNILIIQWIHLFSN